MVEQSSLESLRQIYGDGNIRVRETEARIAALQHDLKDMTGSSAPLAADDAGGDHGIPDAEGQVELYPPLRQIPRLAVPYADLYRRVKVQETVFELLTQQYEMARIEEAKDIPVVSVIDPPAVPEKKSFPPRILLMLLLTFFAFVAAAVVILIRDRWSRVDAGDPRKKLATEVFSVLSSRLRSVAAQGRGAA
jgi:capsule polysaccharide export protein KpsE/RkpR